MKKIVKWLLEVELLAHEVYRQAASVYADDQSFSKFLNNLAEDEAWHSKVMENAIHFLASEPDFTPAITVDKITSDKVEKYFTDMKEGLEKKTLSKEGLTEKIIEAELSEWNNIFIYVVNFLKEKTDEFKYTAARIQTHINELKLYIEKVESSNKILQRIYDFKKIWTENILIVDDEKMITTLIKSLLEGAGNIDIAYNGEEALQLIEKKYFKLIITDIDMPVMDGITLWERVSGKFPESNKRFLFITGDLSPQRQKFFNENRLKCLSKPLKIKTLKEKATEMILSQ